MAVLPGETEIDLSQAPYSVVVKWKDYLAKGRPVPYATPRDEFIQAPQCPTQYQLMQRWEHLPQYWDIPAIYSDTLLPFERQRWQLENLAKHDLEFLVSDKAREIRHLQNIVTLQNGIDEIQSMLDTGVIKHSTKEGNATDGYKLVEHEVRLNPNQISRLRLTQAALIKLAGTLDGQASEIVLHQHSAVGVLERAMRLAMDGKQDKDGFSVNDLEKIAAGDKPVSAMLPAPSFDGASTLPPGFTPTNVIEISNLSDLGERDS